MGPREIIWNMDLSGLVGERVKIILRDGSEVVGTLSDLSVDDEPVEITGFVCPQYIAVIMDGWRQVQWSMIRSIQYDS